MYKLAPARGSMSAKHAERGWNTRDMLKEVVLGQVARVVEKDT